MHLKFLCLPFLMVLSGVVACADVDPSNPYDPSAPKSVQATGTLLGRVLLPDGTPAPGAAVGLEGTSVSTTTGDDGAYTLTEVPSGGHRLTVALACHRTLGVPTPYFDLGEEHTQPDALLEGATGTVRGVVAFAGGPGGRFAEVSVFQPGGGATTHPDDTGHFALQGVRACEGQSLSAVAYGYVPATATGIAVPENGALDLPDPLTLVPLPGAVIGRLVPPADDAGPRDGLPVTVRALGGEVIAGETAEDGEFRLAVPQGPATFIAAVPGYRTLTAAITVPPAQNDDVAADLGDLQLEYAFERVAGTVTLADGADPSPVRLELRNADRQYLAVPGASGQFEFAAVRAGTYVLTAEALGYALAAPLPEVVVADGASVTGLAVALAVKPGILCGQVFFPPETGAPEVVAIDTDDCPPLDPAASTLADAEVRVPTSGGLSAPLQEDGYFRVEPRAGFHTVELVRPGFESLQRFNVPVGDDPASPTDLGALRLDYARAALSGRVSVVDCPPHAILASIVATGPHGTQLVIANIAGAGAGADGGCEQSGVFDFPGLPVGDYDLVVSSDDYISETVRTFVPVAAEAPALEVTLEINPATLRLVLSAEGLSPVDEGTPCDADNTAPFAALEAALVGADGVAHPDCHGQITLSDLRPGTYALRLAGGDDYGVLIVPTVTLAPGGDTDLGQLALPYATGGLIGQITVPLGESAENAVITLSGPSSAVAFTGADGSYSFFGVRAGTYVLAAALPGFRSVEDDIEIERDRVGTAPTLDLVLFPGTVRGRVLPEGGGTAAGTTVSIAGTAIEDTTDEGSSEGELPEVLPGVFELTGIRAGTYSLVVSRPGDPRYRVGSVPNVLVPAGGDVDIGTVELARATGAVTVDVTVEDAARLDAEALALIYGAVTGRLSSRTPGESTRIEANAYGVEDCDGDGNPCARVDFPEVPVDAYTLTLEREDYASASQELSLDADGDVVPVETVLLAILPGLISGEVIGPEGTPLSGVTVTPAGGAPTSTGAAGDFLAGGLREGSYAVTFAKDGYRTTTLPSIGVTAGVTTDIGTLALEYATGSMSGTVALDDEADPAGVVITAQLGADTTVTTVADGDGRWLLSDVRTGTWLVTASRDAYVNAEASAPVDEDGVTLVPRMTLVIDPGTIVGRVVLGDGDEEVDLTDAFVEVLPAGGASTHALADGTFSLGNLKAGTYSLTVTLDGYDVGTVQGLAVVPNPDTDAGDVILHDLKAPSAPTLVLVPEFTPLSGQPDSPAVAAVPVFNPQDVLARPVGLVRLGFDPDGVDPRETDANFNPVDGQGRWQVRSSSNAAWVTVLESVPPFTVPVPFEKLVVVQIRGVDAEGNAGEEAELIIMAVDDTAPAAPSLREPIAGCYSPAGFGSTRRCVVNADAVNIPLAPAGLADKSFGCYFLQSINAPERACDDDADCNGQGTCHAGYCLDTGDLPWVPTTDDCYPAGTQYVTVFPEEGSRVFHCLRAYDKAGQASSPSCMLVEEDSTVPTTPDLFPNEVEVRGSSVSIFALLPMADYDRNIAYFEKKTTRPGANWQRAGDAEGTDGAFDFELIPGRTNELSVRAVDRAGNMSEASSVFIEETSFAEVDSGRLGVGLSPDFDGARLSWANPQGCDQFGQGRLCHFGLILKNDATQHEGAYQVGAASGCFRGCLPGVGYAPLMAQSNFGLFYTDYVPGGGVDTHVVKVLPYGADGEPVTGDEAVIANDCCASVNQNADPTAGIVWMGASDRLVIWVRQVMTGNAATWRAYALALNFDAATGLRRPAGSVVQQTLYQNANIVTAPNDVPSSFSLAGDALIFSGNGTPRVWAKILAANGSLIDNISFPADVSGSIPLVTATANGLAGILVPGAQPTERRLFHVTSLDFRTAAQGGTCPNAACNNLQGCFKGVCFNISRPAGGHPNLACSGNNTSFCGAPKDITSDGGLVAVTVTTTVDGLDYDRILLATDGGAAPTVLVTRPGPVHDTVLNFDRLVTVDESTGAPRLLQIEPTDLVWRGLDPEVLEERSHPRPLDKWTAYVGARNDGRPGLFLLGNDTPGVKQEHALAIPPNPLAHASDVQPWPDGRGFAASGTYLAWTEVMTANGGVPRFRLTTIDTGVLCAAGDATCTPLRACTLDGLVCRDFKQVSAETVTYFPAASPPVVPGRYPLDVAVNTSQVMLHATASFGVGAFSYFMRDFGNNRVHSNLNAGTAIRGADVAAGRLVQCDAAGFYTRSVGAGATEDRLLCLNRLANNMWEARLVVRSSQAVNWNSTTPTSTLFNTNDATHLNLLTTTGTASEAFVIDDRTIALESVIGSAAGQSFPLLRISTAPGLTLGSASDEYKLLYQRVDLQGQALGRTVLAPPNRLVFADSVLTLQPEIMRLNVTEGTLERLTNEEAIQVQPGVNSSGMVMFVDHRYFLTAQGGYRARPAFTMRGLP